MKQQSNTAVIFGFDADGSALRKKEVIKANSFLFEHAKAKVKEHQAVYVGTEIFSNRQDFETDMYNAGKYNTGSFFPAYLTLANHLRQSLESSRLKLRDFFIDRFLLADLYQQRKPGESFNEAIAKNANAIVDTYDGIFEVVDARGEVIRVKSEITFDRTKATIIYAQIQRWAKDNPDKHLHFYYYDDQESILEALFAFFSNYKKLIPSNVTLHFVRYPGQQHPSFRSDRHVRINLSRRIKQEEVVVPELDEYKPIDGEGEVDNDFYDSVLKLAAITKTKMKELAKQESKRYPENKEIDIANSLKQRDVEQFLKYRTKREENIKISRDFSIYQKFYDLPKLTNIAIVEYDSLLHKSSGAGPDYPFNLELLQALKSFQQVWIHGSMQSIPLNLKNELKKLQVNFKWLEEIPKEVSSQAADTSKIKHTVDSKRESSSDGEYDNEESSTDGFADVSEEENMENRQDLRDKRSKIFKYEKNLFKSNQSNQIPIYTVIGSRSYVSQKQFRPTDFRFFTAPLETNSSHDNKPTRFTYLKTIKENYDKLVIDDTQREFIAQKLKDLQTAILIESKLLGKVDCTGGETMIMEDGWSVKWTKEQKLYAQRYNAIQKALGDIETTSASNLTAATLGSILKTLNSDEYINRHRNGFKRCFSLLFSPPNTSQIIKQCADQVLEEHVKIENKVEAASAA